MGLISAVHGVGQQFKGDEIIHREWWPALLSGLHLAGKTLENPKELVCPFYGHLFRQPGALATATTYQPQHVGNEEADLLQLLWHAAADLEPQSVPSPGSYGAALGSTPKVIQRALSALSRSSFFANISQSLLIGDLKQVVLYMNDVDVREKALGIVASSITPETKVVIGHSLGSVIAYEALCLDRKNVVCFISIGSPLGIRNLIFDRLRPPPNAMKIGAWPRQANSWVNIADQGDIVALEKKLAPFFSTLVQDILVNNGSDAHHGERYLTAKESGEAIAAGIW